MDAEVKAMRALAQTLPHLTPEARGRVLRWALEHAPEVKQEIIRDYERARRSLSRTVSRTKPPSVPDNQPQVSRTVSRTNGAIVPDSVPDKGIPPDPSAKPVRASGSNHLRTEAVELLNFLNLKTGKSFRPVDSTLRPIRARLASGVSVQDCKGVIVRQVREWKGTEHEKYLRPETLFGATKFESYLGQKQAQVEEES